MPSAVSASLASSCWMPRMKSGTPISAVTVQRTATAPVP